MKVILKQDVEKLGRKGEVVEVKTGYGRNYLIPNDIAIEATTKNMNRLKHKLAAIQKQNEEELKEAQDLASKIEEVEVEMKLKAGEGGKTFGSVSTKEIAEELKSKFNIEVDRRRFQLEEAIKSLGTHIVNIRLHPDVTCELKVVVSEE